MATLSRILAWRIPCTKELGGLQSIGLHSLLKCYRNLRSCGIRAEQFQTDNSLLGSTRYIETVLGVTPGFPISPLCSSTEGGISHQSGVGGIQGVKVYHDFRLLKILAMGTSRG